MGYDPNQPPQPPYGAPNYQPQPPYSMPDQPPQAPFGAPNQAPYGTPNYAQPPQKKSRRRLWVILGILGGILVLACGGCALTSVLGIGFFAKTIAGPVSAVDGYYKAIEVQDYNKAYTYLQVDNFSVGNQTLPANQAIFTQVAGALDTAKGKVTGHTITSTNVNNDTATVVVNATRKGSPYTVTLQLRKVGNDWKIVQLDNV